MKGKECAVLAERRPPETIEERNVWEEYLRVRHLASFEVPFDFYLQTRSLPTRLVRSALRGLFGIRPTANRESDIALLAYWAKRYLEEKGGRGGILTALILRGLEQKGGSWREGLVLWLELRAKHFPPRPVNLDLPLLHPVWLEVPRKRNIEGVLGALSAFAKDPRLCKKDRETLYLLKDSLMVKLWSEGRLRFLRLIARPRPLPREEALVEAYRNLWQEVEEAFAKGGYEALEGLLAYWEPRDLPKEEDLRWAEERARAWFDAYLSSWDPVVPRVVLTLPPRLLVPLFGLREPKEKSWEEILAERPYFLDPYANYVLTALIRLEDRSFTYHFPYRKARRYRIFYGEENLLTQELPPDIRMGRRGRSVFGEEDLKACLEEMGYPSWRFPCGLRLDGDEEGSALAFGDDPTEGPKINP
jgi:hypothetical protein